MTTATTPFGYSPAHTVSDYTHSISLDGDRTLLFNLLTGLGWEGAVKHRDRAISIVEKGRGTENATDELDRLEENFRSSRRAISFQLIPTYGCNFKCAYCYEGSLTSEQRQWDDQDIQNVVATCKRLAERAGQKLSDCKFTVLGGEVIRESTFAGVRTLVAELRKKGARRFEAITNGYELADHAEQMAEIGITRLQVTIDGPQKMHDKRRPIRVFRGSSFDRITDGVTKCLELGMFVALRINIDQRNIPTLPKLVAHFDEHGWLNHPCFYPYLAALESDYSGKMHFVPESEMAEMVVEAAKIEPRLLLVKWAFHGLDFIYALRAGTQPTPIMRYCGATTQDFTLDARDGVYPCWFGAGQDEFKVGTISDIAAGKPLTPSGAKRLESWRSRGVRNVNHCATCKWALVCGGGCTFKAKTKTDDMMQPNCAPFASIYEIAGSVIYETPRDLRGELRGDATPRIEMEAAP